MKKSIVNSVKRVFAATENNWMQAMRYYSLQK